MSETIKRFLGHLPVMTFKLNLDKKTLPCLSDFLKFLMASSKHEPNLDFHIFSFFNNYTTYLQMENYAPTSLRLKCFKLCTIYIIELV